MSVHPTRLMWTCPSCLRSTSRRASRTIPSSTIRSSITPSPGSHRAYTNTPSHKDNQTQERQAVPLGDFYLDLLNTPIPKTSPSNIPPTSDLPTFVNTGGDKTKEERAALLFGNIRGSGYERTVSDQPDATWRTINGVPVPPRPAEPENCCMSGCVHCVWDDYRDDVEQWAARVKEVQSKGQKKDPKRSTPKIDMPRPEVANASTSMDDDGGGSEALWDTPGDTDDSLFEGIPVGIREFMAMEKKIRERKRERNQSST